MLPQKRTLGFQTKPADDFVRMLSDADLANRCVQGFRRLRDPSPTCGRPEGAGRWVPVAKSYGEGYLKRLERADA